MARHGSGSSWKNRATRSSQARCSRTLSADLCATRLGSLRGGMSVSSSSSIVGADPWYSMTTSWAPLGESASAWTGLSTGRWSIALPRKASGIRKPSRMANCSPWVVLSQRETPMISACCSATDEARSRISPMTRESAPESARSATVSSSRPGSRASAPTTPTDSASLRRRAISASTATCRLARAVNSAWLSEKLSAPRIRRLTESSAARSVPPPAGLTLRAERGM